MSQDQNSQNPQSQQNSQNSSSSATTEASASLLKEKIKTVMVATMKAAASNPAEKEKLGVIRLIQAALKQKEVDERIVLNDEQILNILDKMVRQRQDSVKQFELANRHDLVKKELAEIQIIQEFLPTPLTSAEIQALIAEAVQEVGAQSIRDMGKVMAILKPKLQGRADMGEVGNLIKAQLS